MSATYSCVHLYVYGERETKVPRTLGYLAEGCMEILSLSHATFLYVQNYIKTKSISFNKKQGNTIRGEVCFVLKLLRLKTTTFRRNSRDDTLSCSPSSPEWFTGWLPRAHTSWDAYWICQRFLPFYGREGLSFYNIRR